MWTLGKQTRVCLDHFVDMEPTSNNPYPTLNLGYKNDKRVENITGQSKRRRLTYKEKPSSSHTSIPNAILTAKSDTSQMFLILC